MSNSVTSTFIDLATFDEIEKYLYNGPTAITYFVKCVRKATWFSQVPVTLTSIGGKADFNTTASWKISRAGDYLTYVWLRATLPAVTVSGATPAPSPSGVRWCKNVGHNLIERCSISFNDLTVHEFDSYWLDMNAAFSVTASKQNGYNNMIGNNPDVLTTSSQSLPEYTVNVPLPFFFTRSTGVALPTAALPYNEMKIEIEFRDWRKLLIGDGDVTQPFPPTGTVPLLTPESNIVLRNVQLWANYVVVSNEERVKMGKCPRDMVIEQTQKHNGRKFDATSTDAGNPYDIRMAYALKALFFNVANTTKVSALNANFNQGMEFSNYTTGGITSPVTPIVDFNGENGSDPVALTSLQYENTYRLHEMGSDYFSLVNPFYHFDVIPEDTGYHVYSYSLKGFSEDPMGSTDYGKLTNTTLSLTPSADAVTAAAVPANADYNKQQTFEVQIRANNWNIVRISGGALGLPVL